MNTEHLVKLVIHSSLTGSLLAVLILVAGRYLKSRVKARWICLLWFVLLFRLLIPYIPNSPLLLYKVPETININSPEVIEVPQTAWLNPVRGALPEGKPTPYDIMFVIWLSGALLMLFYMLILNFIFIRRTKRGHPVTDAHILEILNECKREIGIKKDIHIVSLGTIKTPAVLGVFKPLLLLPEGVPSKLGDNDIRNIILHELTHLKHNDLLADWIIGLTLTLHWFNPVIWHAIKMMRSDREMACDEYVLSHLKDEEIKRYGQTILNVLDIYARPKAVPGLVAMVESKKEFKRRLERIIVYRKGTRCPKFFVMLLVIFLAGFTGVNAYEIQSAFRSSPAHCMPKSCCDPRATFAYSYTDATNVIEGTDAAMITDIRSYGKLTDGVETFIVVEVEYSLASMEDARLCIMFNNSSDSSEFIHEGTIPVSEGIGKYVFTIPLTPVIHEEGTPFSLQCCLHVNNRTLYAQEKELKVQPRSQPYP